MNKFFNLYNSLCMGANSQNFAYDPYFFAVKDILIAELKEVVFYIEKLIDFDVDMAEYRNKVIEFISILIVNMDFRRENFFVIVSDLNKNKNILKDLYEKICKDKNIVPDLIKNTSINLNDKEDIIKALNEFEKKSDINIKLTANKKSLYSIMMNLVLNACNCLIELKNYGEDYIDAKNQVLKLINSSNFIDEEESFWINNIKEFAKFNYNIMEKLYEKINNKFGPAEKTKLNICTVKGKCILVSGSSYSDLQKVLKAVENTDINVYTHNNLLNAFQYSFFKSHKNLISHYQHTNNNFAIDFSSFPGPIYITRNSLPKIDAIRGRIFTSAKYPSYGISNIENDDFSPLIETALNSKGFAEDDLKDIIEIGCEPDEFNDKLSEITDDIENGNIKKVIIIGLSDRLSPENEYITRFINDVPNDYSVISFAYNSERKNVWYINPYYDFPLVYKIIKKLKDKINISVFLMDCTNSTISIIFNLIHLGVNKILLGPCCPNIINPQLMEGLNNIFEIRNITNVKNDIKFI